MNVFTTSRYSLLPLMWILYWMLVLLRQALERPIIPIHDGIIGIIVILYTVIFLWNEKPKDLKLETQKTIPVWIIFLILQVFLVTQVYRGLSLFPSVIIVSLTVLLIVSVVGYFYEFSFYPLQVPSVISKRLSSKRIGVYGLLLGIVSTMTLPFLTFLFAQSGISIIWSFIAGIMVHGIVGTWFIRGTFFDPFVVSIAKKSTISKPLQRLHKISMYGGLFLIITLIVLVGVANPRTQDGMQSGSEYMRPLLTQVSGNWRIDPNLYSLPISSGESQYLEFSLMATKTVGVDIILTAYIQSEGGRLTWELWGENGVIDEGQLPSFQCNNWFSEAGFRVRDNCDPIVEKIYLSNIEVNEGREYRVILRTIPHEGPLMFTQNGMIKHGEIRVGPPLFYISSTLKK